MLEYWHLSKGVLTRVTNKNLKNNITKVSIYWHTNDMFENVDFGTKFNLKMGHACSSYTNYNCD